MDDKALEAAFVAGWNACRKSVYAVCEDVRSEADRIRIKEPVGSHSEEQHAKGYHAGTCYAAKSIARGFNSMEALDDDNLRAAIAAYEAARETGWRSIDTAPRCVSSSAHDNGLRPVLVTRWPVDGHHKPVAVARLTNDGWIVGRGGPWRKKLWFEPTHWFSLDDLPNPAPLPSQETRTATDGQEG